MANGIDWFRWHHGSVTDPKFGLVAKKAGARVGDVIAVWALVLEQASAATDRGAYVELDTEATDFLLGADDGTTARILEAMRGRGLITDDRVTRWEERQPKRERVDNTAAERKRAQRERDNAKDGVSDDVTSSHATSHQVTPREEKSREELKNPPIPPKGGDPESQRDSPKRKAAVALKTYLDECKQAGHKAIPEGHAVFSYAGKVGIPEEFLRLQWLEFKARYTMPNAKRYKDWPTVFHKSVQGNWFKLWYAANDGGYALSTVGQQAQRNHQEAA